ncbi:MAG: DNA polymerase I [Ruminococcaceae bacterium]|jgi:DNA polymerase-1|nr:DNA polymerase I [Oscillospiraceae bacterium]
MKLMVIDGNSILNRAYYGIRPLTTREGFYTHAVYGFLTTMKRLCDEEKPDALCVTFDRREPTFRHKEFAPYKAQRKGMPEELAQQLPVIKDVLDAMNVPRYELAGYEADDLIGTISRKCEAADWDCAIVTGDKDSLQLVTERTTVKLVSTRMGQTTTRDMTPETFRAEYGFDPIHMIDLKALMGDASDNYPGVPGIGEKTAMELIGKYQTIDAIYEKLPDIEAKPAAIKKLQDGEESARQSYRLAKILTDAPLDFDPAQNLRKAPSDALYPLFLKLEFNKLIEAWKLTPPQDLPAVDTDAPADFTVTAEAVTGEKRAQELLALWRRADHVTLLALPDLSGLIVDCQTGEKTAVSAELFFARYEGDWNALLRALFASDVKKVSHNVKDLQRTLLENDLPIDGFVFDTALAAYLVNATAGSYDIDKLFVSYFHTELTKPVHLEPDAFSMLGDTLAAETAFHCYTAAVGALYEALRPAIEERQLHELYYDVELPLCAVLARMETAGCLVDRKALADFGAQMEARVSELERRIYDAAGETFNINSPKQLGTILFEKLELPHGKKTKTGWSTNADVLEKLRWENPIVADILQYRQYAKFKSTYCDGLLKVIAPDGRIHTSFQMTATDTGRLSSREPNLQNIPTRTELGSEFRRMFIPAPGCVLVDADYSQIELRLLAHIADDKTMQQAFQSGEDIHTVTASQAFGVPMEQVTKQLRSHAKAVNFGIVYGISAFSLAQDIGVTVADAKAYIESYLARFSGVRSYMESIVEKAKAAGCVETLMHRRRALPELAATNFQTRSFGERVALNMPIQGTAADIVKLAMVRVDARLRREGLKGRLILQVHDELIVECPEGEAEKTAALLTEEMERVMTLSVPLTAEAHWGKNWLEAKG